MRKTTLAIALTVIMIVGTAAPAMAGAASPAQDDVDIESISFSDGVVNPDAEVQYGTAGDIDPALQEAEGTTEVVLRLDKTPQSSLQGVSGDQAVQNMKDHAAATQQNALRYAQQTEGVSVIERFWVVNGILLEVDTNQVNLEELTRIQNVDRAHANFEVTVPETPESAGGDVSYEPSDDGYDTTYGLDYINAPEVWDQYNTQGEGVGVAVLDTGVDPDHPDIDIDPENFVEATEEGVENVDPYDSSDHGTHVSGTVSGGNASGEYIGVAPDVELYHGLVIAGGSGSFATVANGMEWAAEEDGVDVVSMSLGAPGYSTDLIEAAENIEAAGKILVASAGNDGPGSSGNPGNYHTAIAAGASNAEGGIAGFSSGEEVDATSAYPGAVDEYNWPESYVVPDYAAPGVGVKSSVPGGDYSEFSGTSMSAPHISGAIALMLSASGDLSEDQVRTALSDTATVPVEDPDPTRYGDGIIDIKNATDQVSLEQEITGTVTDADGAPIEGATVSSDQGFEATTNADGEYTLLAETGNVTLTASAAGAEDASQTVEVGDNETVTANFSLNPALGVELLEGQADAVEGGDNVTAVASAVNLESYTAELGDGYSAENATLYVNGVEAEFGTPIEFDQPTDVTATVTVETTEGTSGEVSVVHTFAGLGDSVEVTTGPTDVFAEFTKVGVVDDDGEYGSSVASVIEGHTPASYTVDVIDSSTAIDSTGEYDAYVVQYLDESNAEDFVSATGDYSVGTVYLDQWGSDSNGIAARSSALGDPAETDDSFSGDNPSYTNVADHPIFEGTGDDPIQLHTAGFADHTWFTDTDATVLADVSNGEVQGSGVAVSGDRWDILGASLGYTGFVGDDDYTEDADTILGNMVTIAANPPEPAGTVTVTDDTASSDGTAEVYVETDVENVAGYEISMTFDPEKMQLESVTGIDMADPAANIDNENGVVTITQVQAEGADQPKFVKMEFDLVGMDNGDEAEVALQSDESAIYDESGSDYLTNWDNGKINVLDAELGDVNADGEVTAGDAIIVQRYIAGLPTDVPDSQIETLGDVNQDGDITSADVTAILEIVLGNEEPPEPEEDSESRSLSDSQIAVGSGVALAG